jgi:hypothetical protein
VSRERRYRLNLTDEIDSGLQEFAQRLGLSLGPALQLLIARGLQTEAASWRRSDTRQDSPAALAGLAAAEQAVLMVASVLPEGQRRMHELAAEAAVAAEARLALFRESGL